MIGFGIIYLKPNHGPNVVMLIWDIVRFALGHQVYQPWSCPKFDLGYPKLKSEHNHISDTDIPNQKFQFGKSEIEKSIWECSKSKSE